MPLRRILHSHVILSALLVETALAQAPVIKDIRPLAAVPGETTEVFLEGENLAEATELWTSFRGEAHFVRDSAESARLTCHMTLPRDRAVGIGGLRVATERGVSRLRLFMIDDLRSTRGAADNVAADRAQVLSWPVAIDGRVTGDEKRYFRLHLDGEQRVALDVVAQRLGSELDPVLRVLDLDECELHFVDDTPGVGTDCRLAFEAPRAGDYLIELRDLRYRGGEKAFFRLRVGDFPLGAVPFPMGTSPGEDATLSVVGPAAREVPPLHVQVPGDMSAGSLSVELRFPGGRSSDSVTLLVDSLPDIVEVEPNDSPLSSTAIEIPMAVNGRLEKPRDRDHYSFSAAKGQKLSVLAMTRSAGAPTDLLFALLDSEGNAVATADVEGSDDGTLVHRFSEAGRYVLRVEGLNRDGGPQHAYRLKVEPFEPHVLLSVETETVNIRPGDEITFDVACERQGYNGPVALSIESRAGDWKLLSSTIAKGKESGKLKAVAPPSLTPARCHLVRVIGEIDVDGTKVRTVATTRPALRKLFPLTLNPPRGLDGIIGVGVSASPESQ